MIIDTIISDIIKAIQLKGHNATELPLELYNSSTNMDSNVLCVYETESELEPFESYNQYINRAGIDIDIQAKTNDNSISISRGKKMRDDVIDVIRNYTDHQIIIYRTTRTHTDTGTVVYKMYCRVLCPIV